MNSGGKTSTLLSAEFSIINKVLIIILEFGQ